MAAPTSATLPFPQLVTIALKAIAAHDGPTLALCLGSPLSASTPDQQQLPRAVLGALTNSSERFLHPLAARLPEPWREVVVGHVQVLVLIQQGAFAEAGSAAEVDSWEQAYKAQNTLVSAYLQKHLAQSTAWSLPVLHVLLRTLRQLATKADALALLSPLPPASSGGSSSSSGPSGGWVRSEAVARTTMKAFTICATDRSSAAGSADARQWAIYALGGALIKAYFALGRPSLAANLIRAVANAPNKPALEAYPKADQVTWRFLMGTLALLDGRWSQARDELERAWTLCHRAAQVQQRQILTGLIPLELVVNGRLPSAALLGPHPTLDALYGPFIAAVRRADLAAYDRALERSLAWAVDKRVFAALERAREVVLRGALRKTWLALGRPNRVSVGEFQAGLALLGGGGGTRDQPVAVGAEPPAGVAGGVGLDSAEDVECLLAGMIYKGYVKGYISHAHQVVVLSKQGPFPPLRSRVAAGPE